MTAELLSPAHPLQGAQPGPRPVTPLGIVAQSLGRVLAGLETGAVAGPDVVAELRHAYEITAGMEPYLLACSSPESPALGALAARTQAEDWGRHAPASGPVPLEQEMLSGHLEGLTLQFLVRLTGARRVLDIGMFTGYSALAMAEALPPDGGLVACEVDPAVAAIARECFQASSAGDLISIRVGPAAATLAELSAAGEAFDLVFIDADKAGYLGYLHTLLDGPLLAPGGLICVDNTLMQGHPYVTGVASSNGEAIAAFNAAVAADERLETVLLPVRDGLSLIRRR